MITVKLLGGLGNQLFEYSFGRYLALQLETSLKLDLIELQRIDVRTHIKRHYELKVFPNLCGVPDESRLNHLLNHPNPVLRRLARFYNPWGFRYIKQQGLIMPALVPNRQFDYYLDGYFLGYQHLDVIRDQLLDDLSEPRIIHDHYHDLERQILNAEHSVFFHVRRGDYVSPALIKQFSICTAEYYEQALVQLQQLVPGPINVFVFSDDIEWVKANPGNLPSSAVFVSDGVLAPHEELLLMSRCQHGIISNSTFSWWGAWLIANANKVIVTPNEWMRGNVMKHNFDEIVPPNWHRVPC